MPFSRGSSQPKDQTRISYVSCIGRQVLYHQRHLGSASLYSFLPPHPRDSQRSGPRVGLTQVAGRVVDVGVLCLDICVVCPRPGHPPADLIRQREMKWVEMTSH